MHDFSCQGYALLSSTRREDTLHLVQPFVAFPQSEKSSIGCMAYYCKVYMVQSNIHITLKYIILQQGETWQVASALWLVWWEYPAFCVDVEKPFHPHLLLFYHRDEQSNMSGLDNSS